MIESPQHLIASGAARDLEVGRRSCSRRWVRFDPGLAEVLQKAAANAGGATKIVNVRSATEACNYVRANGADLVLLDRPLAVETLAVEE